MSTYPCCSHCADDQPHVEKDSHTLPCDLCRSGIPMTRYHASGNPLMGEIVHEDYCAYPDECSCRKRQIVLSMVGQEEAEARLAAMPDPLDLPDHEVFFEMGQQGGSYRLGIEYTEGIRDEIQDWLAYRRWRQEKLSEVAVCGDLEYANRKVVVNPWTDHRVPREEYLAKMAQIRRDPGMVWSEKHRRYVPALLAKNGETAPPSDDDPRLLAWLEANPVTMTTYATPRDREDVL
jgi:hypothetical protein